jgi:hypothetical protein
VRRGCQSTLKMARIWLKRLKNTRLKFDSILFTGESPVDEGNSFLERKTQNQMFMDSIIFY